MPLRRDQIEMTLEERRTYLREQRRLILTSNGPDGYPHPMPMNFVYDDQDRFLITTFRKSQKVANFRRDPRAALLVESGLAYNELKSVLAYADAEIIEDRDVIVATMTAIGVKEGDFGTGVDQEKVDSQIEASVSKRLVIRFDPARYITWNHSKLGGTY